MKKVALHNLGCKVNSYETEVMQQKLKENGFLIVPFEQKADVYIINTCSVTNMADRKSRQMLHKAKKNNPESVVVAVGCYVQTREEEEILEDGVDLVIGNNKKKELISILNHYFDGLKEETVIDINHTNEYEEMKLTDTTEHTRAYIKVQDGCNQFCSYCIIPYARGRVRSRKREDVLAEVKGLSVKGYSEVVLTGIHLSSYGIDIEDTLLSLITAIHEIEGIKRIRLGSLEPRIITEEFVQKLIELPKICPHFHLSLQSGCNETLKRMNRKYSAEEFLEKVELLRKYFDRPALTTDVIVGFPGETQEEFEQTVEFLKKVHFYEMHIFKYSKRKGTKAAVMEEQIGEEVKSERSNELLELNSQNKSDFEKQLIGKEMEMLVEERIIISGENFLTGYTKEYVKVGFFDKEDHTNKILKGKLDIRKEGDIILFQKNTLNFGME
ncbi:MAG: tRNA (N(6)-L-threonylcarbamoyladenosine(37)-C(2))-methylthiotransferase MtaB [Lachnospiraceae bacterium]|nr:tRNA (N(6)-L-threonylcarbamoyladenosine(37)-C(2))-methylthiotransferase MtaB [Lachnospiraceae bacterium]